MVLPSRSIPSPNFGADHLIVFGVIHKDLKLVVSALTEEQVKAGVAYAASPAHHIGRQSRPFRRLLDFSLGGLLKGRPISSISEKFTSH